MPHREVGISRCAGRRRVWKLREESVSSLGLSDTSYENLSSSHPQFPQRMALNPVLQAKKRKFSSLNVSVLYVMVNLLGEKSIHYHHLFIRNLIYHLLLTSSQSMSFPTLPPQYSTWYFESLTPIFSGI